MKIKHFVITRFLNNANMNLGQRIFDEDVVRNGVSLVKSFLIPSLMHQSNKNFIIILIIHENLNKDFIKELYELKCDFPILILTNPEYKQYIKEEYNKRDCDFFITSRVDYDDMFYYNAVQDVQESVDASKPILTYTWKNGAIKRVGEKIYREFSPDYHNNGGIGIMLSLIINNNLTKSLSKGYDVYDFNHTQLTKCIRENFDKYCDLTLDYEPLIINKRNGICWVYIRHNQTDSNYSRDNNDIIDFNKEEFFGLI